MGHKRVQTRVNDELKARIEEYQESEEFLNQAEAVRSLLRDGLEKNEPDEVEQAIEDNAPEPVPDGGYLRRSDHPWIDPLVNFAYRTAGVGLWILVVSMLAVAIPSGAIEWFGAELSQETAALFLSVFTLGMLASTVMVAVVCGALAALEYLMHPSEAPVRQYFYTADTAEDDTVIA